MAAVLSFPFRFNADGSVATVDSASDAGIAEQINAFIQTIRGERPLALGYGMIDPVFETDIDIEVLMSGVFDYCPEATIDNVTASLGTSGDLQILVEFSRAES